MTKITLNHRSSVGIFQSILYKGLSEENMKFGGNSKIKFIKSATEESQYPKSSCPEIGIVGRSNAGKSSFINLIYNTRIAKVSGTPGKTTLLNFFSAVSGLYNVVDMPGYGFAARSKKEVDSWKPMVENYIARRESLVGIILVMDIRRDWTAQEQDLVDWVAARGIDTVVILSKADKLAKTKVQQAVAKIKKASGLSDVLPISSLKKTGAKEAEEYIFDKWIHKGD